MIIFVGIILGELYLWVPKQEFQSASQMEKYCNHDVYEILPSKLIFVEYFFKIFSPLLPYFHAGSTKKNAKIPLTQYKCDFLKKIAPFSKF